MLSNLHNFALALLSAGALASAEPPNVLFIVADDAEIRDLGSYGGELPTPNLDRLAAEGVRFTDCYAAATVCTPSRFAFLTGKHPSHSSTLADIEDPWPSLRWNTFIVEEDTTLADRMNDAGYRTGFVGKWHNGHPRQWHVPNGAWIDAPEYQDELVDNAKIRADFVQRVGGFDQAEAVYTENTRWLPLPATASGHQQHWLTHATLPLMQPADTPWFVYHATTIPHPPDITVTIDGDLRITPVGIRDDHVNAHGDADYEDLQRRVAEHGPFETWEAGSETAGVLWLDDAVGALMNHLDETGQLDNTVVIFTSDHGRDGKFVLNEGRVPLLVRMPGGEHGGKVVDGLVSLVDLVPTVLELAEQDKPDGLDGVSMLPLIEGTADSVRDSVYMEVTLTRAVATPRWKYIATRFPPRLAETITAETRQKFNQEGTSASFNDPDGNVVRYRSDLRFPGYFDDDQLYDLHADPGEQINLANDPEHAETLAEMRKLLGGYVTGTPYPFGEFGKPKNPE
ncbi:MAG: sulfatase-like hydrolase/transferase [Planctomycetota bacterium]